MDIDRYKGGVVFKWINKNEIYAKYNGKGKSQNLQAHIDKLHADYIATRSGVDTGFETHGLFGNILDSDEVEFFEIDTIKKHIQEISKKNIDIYKTVISIKSEDAMESGYYNKQAWKELLEERILDISKAFKIPLSDLEWVAAFHAKKDKPHCHLMVWNQNQDMSVRRKPFVNYKQIRTAVAKSVFRKDLKLIYEIKDISKSLMGEKSKKEIENIEDELKEIMPSIFNTPIISSKVKQENIQLILNKMAKLEEVSSSFKRGFIYKYQEPESKRILNEITMLLINSNKDCKDEFNKYIDTCVKIDKILQKINTYKDYEKVRNSAKSEILKKVGNQILKSIKETKSDEYKIKSEEWKSKKEYWNLKHKEYETKQGKFEARQEIYEQQLRESNIRHLIQDTYTMLSEECMSKFGRFKRATRTFGDKSKREIKEIIKNSQSTGFDWFGER